MLAEVSVPIPGPSSFIDKADVEVHEFVSKQLVSHGHAGLGSGQQFSMLPDSSAVGRGHGQHARPTVREADPRTARPPLVRPQGEHNHNLCS